MSDLPKISIITPSFNQGQYIEQTIQSIISQDYFNYELIIIDGGSTDNTLEVIHKYEPWITYWVSEPDRGQSHAIQKGLARASGEIINWINSDDIVAPGAFYIIAAEFDLEAYDVICGYCDYFVDELNHLDLRGERMGLGSTISEIFLKGKINQPSTFYKASVIKALGIGEQFRYTMDLDLWYRYLLRSGQERVLLSNNLLTYFRLHSSSKSVAENSRFEGDIWRVYYNILYSADQNPALLRFMKNEIPESSGFVPEKYTIKVDRTELNEFILHFAWLALHFYNRMKDYAAVRECLAVVLHNGQAMNADIIKQLIKLYLLPDSLIRFIASRSSKQ